MTAKDRTSRWLATSVIVAMAAMLAFIVITGGGSEEEGGISGYFLLAAGVAFALVGALIIARTDGNRVGWVASAIGLTLLGSGVVGYFEDQGSVVAGALGGALWTSWFGLAGFLMLWFPTGRPVSARWRWVSWLGFLVLLIAMSYIVSDQICVEGGDPCAGWADNPIGISGVPNPEYGPYSGVSFSMLLVFVLLSAASLIVRLVRARGVERLQMKWFLFAVVSVILVVPFQEAVVGWLSIPKWIGELAFGIAILLFPVSIGVSVLRYRLYEIDKIVSRTVSYTVVVVLLAAVYVGAVTWLTTLIPEQSELAVAATTLVVATLFNPVRRRVQTWVDRRFNRSRYDTQRVMDDFAGSLRDQVDTGTVVDGWVGVVTETMQPSTVSVWTSAPFRNDSGTIAN